MTGAWRGWAAALGMALAAVPLSAQGQAASGRLTLADALARARAVSAETAAARARADASRRASEEAGRWPNPVVEVRSENWFSGVPRDQLPLDTFAEVTQVVELGGKRSARRGVAQAAAVADGAVTAAVDRQQGRAVAAVYLEAVRQREHQRVQQALQADLGEFARVLERRAAAGTAAEADLLKARAETARTVLDRVRADVAAARALAELAARLDLEPALDSLEVPSVPGSAVRDGDQVLALRPDLQAAREAVVVARETLRLEEARAVPDPALNGGLKRTTGLNTAQFTVTLPLPFFNRNQQARALATGALRAAEFSLQAAERRARGEWLAATAAAERLAAHARDVRTTLVAPADAARVAARAAFQAGALDILRLVDAERLAADAARVSVDLEIDAALAAIDARLAAGEEILP